MMKLTLFDLDYTLLPIDSDYAWGVFTSTIGWTDASEFNRRNDAFLNQYQAGTLDIHDYVRFATAAMRQQGFVNSRAAQVDFMKTVVAPAIRPQALALVRAHQREGDAVVLVTATNEFVTQPIAQAFGIGDLIALELERDTSPGGSGWITGEIKGVPSFREGKIMRVEQWLASRGLSWATVESTFYTDSINDLSLLEKVTHPVATNPDERLRSIATARGWRILELF